METPYQHEITPDGMCCDLHRATAGLPKRRPGTHWTGPSGEHIEVPLTPRTLVNLRRTLRTIT
jgi:hypothetical protein